MNTTKSERKRIRNRKKRDSGRIGGVRPVRRTSALTSRTRSVTNDDSNDLIVRTAETLSTISQTIDEERQLTFEEETNENDIQQHNQSEQQNHLDQQTVEQQIVEHSITQEQHMIGQFHCITSSELSDFDRTPLINDGSNEVIILNTILMKLI